VFVFAVS